MKRAAKAKEEEKQRRHRIRAARYRKGRSEWKDEDNQLKKTETANKIVENLKASLELGKGDDIVDNLIMRFNVML